MLISDFVNAILGSVFGFLDEIFAALSTFLNGLIGNGISITIM